MKRCKSNPVRTKRNHPPTCHPDRSETERRDLPKLQALPHAGYICNLGRFLHSADATVGMTYRRLVSYFHTGCVRYAACGDESSPLHCVVPFIRTGYNRDAAGTAHRPFPTYFNEWGEMNNVGRSNNCQLSIVNCQLKNHSLSTRCGKRLWNLF